MAKHCKSGYEIVKTRNQELEQRIADLNIQIKKQADYIEQLREAKEAATTKFELLRVKDEELINNLFEHMGMFRRWLWTIKNAKQD